ncbi:MAG: hypothetical protein FJX89_03420 [Bacteroidetes bacterium]|nr:hypothetical protein [Bacteroidota bacterium]
MRWMGLLFHTLPAFIRGRGGVHVGLLPQTLASDPRFGLGIGALFAAVANSYITNSIIPNTGELSLTDLINLVGTCMILLTLIESAISLYIFENQGKHELARKYDRYSFIIILTLYILLNVALAVAAIA